MKHKAVFPKQLPVAAIKALNQIIRQKHQKGLSGSSNSLLCITPHITILRCEAAYVVEY